MTRAELRGSWPRPTEPCWNHGPDATVAAKLAGANLATNGNLTYGVSDVAPTAREMSTLKNLAQVSELAHGLGKMALPVGIAADAYSIYNGVREEGGSFGKNATAATAGAAGGCAGAAAGGWAASMPGPRSAP